MKFVIVFVFAAFVAACDNAGKPVAQSNNLVPAAASTEKPQTAISHTTENQTPANQPSSGAKSKWTQGGEAFDTSKLDAAIMAAEKTLSGKPSDDAAKKALASAYLDRANALTEKRQYASALGDYRRTVKYDASNAEAKQWIEQITMIYASINRDSPKEGEEPPPLPYKKGDQ